MGFAIRRARAIESKRRVRCPARAQAARRVLRPGAGVRRWIAVLASGLFLTASAAATDTARWTIGHVALQMDSGAHGQLQVKLSLRNQGKPDRVPVRLFGRWIATAQAPRRITAQDLRAFVLLGRYEREVAMKQTAVVTAPLTALRSPPPGSDLLELAVFTGTVMTDQGRVAVGRH